MDDNTEDTTELAKYELERTVVSPTYRDRRAHKARHGAPKYQQRLRDWQQASEVVLYVAVFCLGGAMFSTLIQFAEGLKYSVVATTVVGFAGALLSAAVRVMQGLVSESSIKEPTIPEIAVLGIEYDDEPDTDVLTPKEVTSPNSGLVISPRAPLESELGRKRNLPMWRYPHPKNSAVNEPTVFIDINKVTVLGVRNFNSKDGIVGEVG